MAAIDSNSAAASTAAGSGTTGLTVITQAAAGGRESGAPGTVVAPGASSQGRSKRRTFPRFNRCRR